MSEQHYRIVKLKVNNFKNLKAVEITPEGNVITLTGENGAGKSAILDAMQAALAGKDGSAVSKPIREGAVAGETDILLSYGLRARRRYTASGSTLRVEVADESQRSPQAVLDALTNGILGFDPFAFTRLKPAEQRETFLKLAGLDFTQHDIDRQTVYTARTDAGREVFRLEARLSGCKSHADAPVAEQAASQIIAAINAAEEHNRGVEAAFNSCRALGESQTALGKEIANAELQIAAWQTKLGDLKKKATQDQIEHDRQSHSYMQMKQIAVVPLHEKLVTLELDNLKFRENSQRINVKGSLDEAIAKVATLNARVESFDALKAKAIREAKSPLEGLTFDDAGLLYLGRPLTESSTGHRIRVAVAIGMALNPKLRVIFVRDGSLLDADGLKVIAELAKVNDYQVWIEDARSSDPAALVIEDGELRNENQTNQSSPEKQPDAAGPAA